MLTIVDEERQKQFLKAYAVEGTITHASNNSGIDYRNHYRWLKEDDDYPEKFRMSVAKFMDTVEREALRRAVKGWKEPVYQQGVLVGKKRKFSDRLMHLVLQSRRRDVYGNKQEISGPDGQALRVQVTLPHNERDAAFNPPDDS